MFSHWLCLLLILVSFCFVQGHGVENDVHRMLLGVEEEKINLGDDEKVIILSMSSVWFKGIIAMNVGIFMAVMVVFVIQCKKCINDCMMGGRRGRYRGRGRRLRGDKYDKLQLTTDVTELDDTVYEDDQTDI
eukprot:CAMPEP_0197033610 /NCGR_PEP_ID=MMETSP1384-20130603/11980_1 /TAXON_ID=29189 /ORGANISM="Ammonia sp." /LENGTH=131 /DNA_ID=CAMNT_0042463449 /DNA_START=79 /DNA_END=474 /DNA_ORIENTATION=+